MFQALRQIAFASLVFVTTTLVFTPKANAEGTFLEDYGIFPLPAFIGGYIAEKGVDWAIANPPIRITPGEQYQNGYSPFPQLPVPDYRVSPPNYPMSDIDQYCQIFGPC